MLMMGLLLGSATVFADAFSDRIQAAAALTVPREYTNETGRILRYRWAEPAKVESGKRYPLVILCHGAGERGTNNVTQLVWGGPQLLDYMREKGIEGYFLAGQVPEGKRWVEKDWAALSHRMDKDPSETMGLLLALIDRIRTELPVDPARIYVTGVSMGGYGTWELLQRRPELFAAGMPCCGGGDTHEAWRLRDVPVWAWHGDTDGAVPVSRSRDMVSALWAIDGKIRYTEIPGCGHGVWGPAYASREALDWLFAQRKP